MKGKHLISIVMPCYNSEAYIESAIKSVLCQTYENFELLITDDCSSDSTCLIVERLSSKDSRIKFHKLDKNCGAGRARNNCINLAEGRFIAFLDADDLWVNNKLELQLAFMLENKYEFTYTFYQKFTSEKCLSVVTAPLVTSYNKLLYSNVIGCLTVIYDTERIGKLYMPLIRKRQDLGLWLEILNILPHAYCLPLNLARYRIDSGMTSNKFTVLSYQWRFYRNVIGLSLSKSLFAFCVYSVKGLLKSIK
ncbi:glycosyltransferase family 2 protein [Shewanella sp. MMG014]|uniref:glycosyltransferase family 2 protein n=1 Tax=Shewanella sp. MMG014 TaxID=2822691 RepID=UPI001B37758A|nr:glycosyltransferase family 2 protein [Shewanella sp. MMG014]MBQ4888540.1 glycosyltransferase family 2 protein [Shewanella sp. MMG014]